MQDEIMGAVQPEAADVESTAAAEEAAAGNPDAIPEDTAAGTDAGTAEGSGETGPEADAGDQAAGEDAAQEAPAPVVRVKFNKQERELPLEEAAPYVEMGMKYEGFKPTMDKLRFIAESVGQTVDGMVDQLIQGHEASLYQRALEETGGNEAAARKLADLQIDANRRRFEESKAAAARAQTEATESERAALEKRLASDFLELQREMPGVYTAIAQVPSAVMRLAVSRGIPLLDAAMRVERAEAKKRTAVERKQEETAARSTGALGDQGEGPGDAAASAFEAAFNRAMSN